MAMRRRELHHPRDALSSALCVGDGDTPRPIGPDASGQAGLTGRRGPSLRDPPLPLWHGAPLPVGYELVPDTTEPQRTTMKSKLASNGDWVVPLSGRRIHGMTVVALLSLEKVP